VPEVLEVVVTEAVAIRTEPFAEAELCWKEKFRVVVVVAVDVAVVDVKIDEELLLLCELLLLLLFWKD